MKCNKCGVELTDKVYAIHITRCKAEPKAKEIKLKKDPVANIQRELMKAELDAKGIKYAPNAKNEFLMKLINESKEDKEAV